MGGFKNEMLRVWSCFFDTCTRRGVAICEVLGEVDVKLDWVDLDGIENAKDVEVKDFTRERIAVINKRMVTVVQMIASLALFVLCFWNGKRLDLWPFISKFF